MTDSILRDLDEIISEADKADNIEAHRSQSSPLRKQRRPAPVARSKNSSVSCTFYKCNIFKIPIQLIGITC